MMIFVFFLIAVAMAIDLRFMNQPNCKGNTVACLNLKPDTCCFVPSGRQFRHFSFVAVPGDWRIKMRGFVQYDCNGALLEHDSERVQGFKDYCFDTPAPTLDIRSGRYWFLSNAREASTTPSTNCSLVDTMILEDGRRYALHGLDEDAISEAFEGALNGTVEAAINKFDLALL
ncbi:hypothetical protein BU23DRAFT_637097 [Bimuria novae-zelandiae CBS 107.79]|uniref:Uncharacterized protein n=1 Tax=Bimuria novae-zelandiae CBS 107.79 TaxID=1447943 RepID=A0A6A5VT66_9PLEO|nr:hypothetical protein BU23DRAFT_637097 [Bimuria novae-zelandiae CBS 107.79]